MAMVSSRGKTSPTVHRMALHIKDGSPYVTDDGRQVPPHELYRCSCSCGWEGAGWYANATRAKNTFERHVRKGAPHGG